MEVHVAHRRIGHHAVAKQTPPRGFPARLPLPVHLPPERFGDVRLREEVTVHVNGRHSHSSSGLGKPPQRGGMEGALSKTPGPADNAEGKGGGFSETRTSENGPGLSQSPAGQP